MPRQRIGSRRSWRAVSGPCWGEGTRWGRSGVTGLERTSDSWRRRLIQRCGHGRGHQPADTAHVRHSYRNEQTSRRAFPPATGVMMRMFDATPGFTWRRDAVSGRWRRLDGPSRRGTRRASLHGRIHGVPEHDGLQRPGGVSRLCAFSPGRTAASRCVAAAAEPARSEVVPAG